MSLFRKPVGQQAEDLELAGRQGEGVRPCRGARPARKSAHTLLAQPARDDRCGGACVEALEQLEGATEPLLVAALAECERRLIRAVQLEPEGAGGAPLSCGLEPVHLPCVRRDVGIEPGQETPGGELAEQRLRTERERLVEHTLCRGGDTLPVARKPGCLCPGRCDRPQPIHLAGRLGEAPRLVEQL